MADRFITREQASKFFDVFNRKTKNTYIAIDAKACDFSDIANADKTLVYHI
jgi:predicted nucleic-acid-binding Zn-ribbon protein